MATNDLKKTQTTIASDLNTILAAPSLAVAFKSPNFQTLVEKQLDILAFLERKHKSKTIESIDLLNKYNTLSGKHFNINTNIAYTSDTALIDDANYLNIYLRNIYKVDVQALTSGTKADIPNLTVNDAPGQNTGAAVGGMPFPIGGMMGGVAPAMQNQMMAAMAQAKIQQQAAVGEVYLYKNKPKYIPILKWALLILLALAALSAIFVGTGMLCTLADPSWVNTQMGGDISSLRYDSISYFLFALALVLSVMNTVRGMTPNKTKKINDNQLYSLRWQSYLFVIMLFVFVIAFGLGSGDRYIFETNCAPWLYTTGGSIGFGLWASFIGYIVMLSASGISMIIIIIGTIYSPKLDVDRLNILTKQYIDEMSRTPPTTPPGAPGF